MTSQSAFIHFKFGTRRHKQLYGFHHSPTPRWRLLTPYFCVLSPQKGMQSPLFFAKCTGFLFQRDVSWMWARNWRFLFSRLVKTSFLLEALLVVLVRQEVFTVLTNDLSLVVYFQLISKLVINLLVKLLYFSSAQELKFACVKEMENAFLASLFHVSRTF